MHNDIEESLKLAILLTSFLFIVEVIGGLASNSLSLLGDAGHMFRDVFALFVSLSTLNIAKRLPTKTKTFGYHRTEIFAAFFNGILLVGVSVWIFFEAYRRFFNPKPIESVIMFAVALLGLMVNLYVAFKLHGSHDLNVKSAFTHVFTDALSSIAVISASIWIFFTGQTLADSILSILISTFILFSGFKIIKDAVYILLEFAPKEVRYEDVIKNIEAVGGVQGVHNVHLWSLCSNVNVIDAHILTDEVDMRKIESIKGEIKKRLKKYKIKHATLEFECEECMKSGKFKKMKH